MLDAMEKVNIPVVTTIWDMSSLSVKALKDMRSDISRPYIAHNGKKIFTIFDIPHLLKCFRNLVKKI